MKIDLTDKHFTEAKIVDYLHASLSSHEPLEELNLTGNPIGSLSFLASYPTLKSLNISDTLVTTIPELTQLQNNLEELFLSATKVTDISSLRFYHRLKNLDLTGTKIQDVSVLSKLAELETLSLSSTKVDDSCIEYLLKLRKLKTLYLNNVDVSDEALLRLSSLTSLDTVEIDDEAVKWKLNLSIAENRKEGQEFISLKPEDFSTFVRTLLKEAITPEQLRAAAGCLPEIAQSIISSVCETSNKVRVSCRT